MAKTYSVLLKFCCNYPIGVADREDHRRSSILFRANTWRTDKCHIWQYCRNAFVHKWLTARSNCGCQVHPNWLDSIQSAASNRMRFFIRRTQIQVFNINNATLTSSLMTLSCLFLGLPTVYAAVLSNAQDSEIEISRSVSVLLAFTYVQFLVFQLYTHADLFATDDLTEAGLGPAVACILLLIATVACSFCTEIMVGSIEAVVEHWDVSKAFIGIILLPIIGNAAEHYTAVTAAVKNQMDLAVACAVGSSCQVALFVTPFSVITAWLLGIEMTLDFHPFEMAVLLLSVLIINSILLDGASNWLEGSMLISAYAVIGLIYFFEEKVYDDII